MIRMMSKDLPEPLPPLQTTLSMSGFIEAFQTEWKGFGISSDNLITLDIDIINKLDGTGVLDFLLLGPQLMVLAQ